MKTESLFNYSFKKYLPYEKAYNFIEENGISNSVSKIFSTSPYLYWAENYDLIFKKAQSASGSKVRVPISNIQQLLATSRVLPAICDVVVFSPAPVNPDCSCPWPEFLNGSYGIGSVYFNPVSIEFLSWLTSVRPLIENGSIVYLPHFGDLHLWDYPLLETPTYSKSYLYKLPLRDFGTYQLSLDNYVSKKLGCLHSLPSIKQNHLLISDLSTPTTNKAKALLKLEIPYIENITPQDLAKIKNDEYLAYKELQRSILAGLNKIPENIEGQSELDNIVANIKSEIIDEPLQKLENRLRQLTKYQSLLMAGYSVASSIMLISAATGDGIFALASQAFGTVNVLKAYESFIKFLETRAKIKEESHFYLYRLKKKSSKKK